MKQTLKQFAADTAIPETLIRAVVRQVGGWESFQELAQDVTEHGADGGFSGFIYYTDTVAFTRRQKANILELLQDMADDFGQPMHQVLCNSNCLKGESDEDILDGLYNPRSDMRTTVYNALAWFALEEVCRAYCDWKEE